MIATGENVSLVTKSNDGAGPMKKGRNIAITQQMAKLEMTQSELARKSKLHLTNINAIVNGTRPRVDNAIRVARALETTAEKLWGDDVK